MDEVKRLLQGFADQAADGLPPADIDADVARGRRALRRIRRRRRVTGVLCVAAASAAVLAIGDQVQWWNSGGTPVAGGESEPTASVTPSPTVAEGGETMSVFGGTAVELVANRRAWNTISCALAPRDWTPETPIAADRVVLSQPTVRTADATAKLVLQAAPRERSLTSARVTESSGKTIHIGTLDGRVAGQVKVADQWLLVELPAGTQDWTDDLLRRFLASCTVG